MAKNLAKLCPVFIREAIINDEFGHLAEGLTSKVLKVGSPGCYNELRLLETLGCTRHEFEGTRGQTL